MGKITFKDERKGQPQEEAEYEEFLGRLSAEIGGDYIAATKLNKQCPSFPWDAKSWWNRMRTGNFHPVYGTVHDEKGRKFYSREGIIEWFRRLHARHVEDDRRIAELRAEQAEAIKAAEAERQAGCRGYRIADRI